MDVRRRKLPILRSHLTAPVNSPCHGHHAGLRTESGPSSAGVPTINHLPEQLVCLPASQDMLAFNAYVWLSSPRATAVGVQRPGTIARAGSSLLKREFQEAALFYSLRRAKYLPGCFPLLCIFSFVE